MGKAGNFPGEARFPNLDLPVQQARGSQGWRICEERAKWTTNLPAGLSRCFPASRFSKRYSRFFWFTELPNSPAIGMQRAGRREYHRLDRDQKASFSSEDAMR